VYEHNLSHYFFRTELLSNYYFKRSRSFLFISRFV